MRGTTARPKPNWENRTLYHGDNLDFMRSMDSATVDLIATDPPFNKGRDFHATSGSLAAGGSFQDRWRWDGDVHPEWVEQMQDDWPGVWAVIDWTRLVHSDEMAAFLCFMAVRLVAMRRILHGDGSIYLHCDSTAGAYLKTLMDAVFGPKQFRREVVWNLQTASGYKSRAKSWIRGHEVILFYRKSARATFHKQHLPYKPEYVARFKKVDEHGRRYRDDRGKGRRQYLDTARGVALTDVWSDVMPFQLQATSRERNGYPTQKPLALYRRMIRASSNPGDVVFDPFAGCATASVAAELEGRQWVACDIWDGTHGSVLERLAKEAGVGEDGQRRLIEHRHVHLRHEPLVRTDDGKTAAPALRTLTRKVSPPSMKREQMVAALIARHGIACQGCGRRFDSARYLELDHHVPRSEGGSNELENRVLLCGPCNRTKGSTLTLTGLRKKNRQMGFMAGQGAEAKPK